MMAIERAAVARDDLAYQAQAEAEARFWNTTHPWGQEVWEADLTDGPTDFYANERLTGNKRTRWHETIPTYGNFKQGLVLGTSGLRTEADILRQNPALHATFADISPGALERRAESLGSRFPGRVSTLEADFNFLDLSPSSYDLIVSSSSLHHVTNLEHVGEQIASALTADGFFFLQDYVGEPRFQFSERKRRVFELLSNRDYVRARQPAEPVQWRDSSDLSPFCGLRSDEILPVLARYLEPIRLRTAGTLLVPLLRASRAHRDRHSFRARLGHRLCRLRPSGGRAPRQPLTRNAIDDRFLGELILVGDVLTDSGVLTPGNAFAIYRRKGRDAV